jgi:precorrin-3B synthase
MMSGDGLVVRVRPRLGRLEASKVMALCALAERYGDGGLELTNRANIQIYGVAEDAHAAMIEELRGLALLDADAETEARRNILLTPFWTAGDVTQRLWETLVSRLSDLPALPPKMGFAIDTTAKSVLQNDPADIRIERGAEGLILRADGTSAGRPVSEAEAIPALIEMAEWFMATRRPEHRRMRALVAEQGVPEGWSIARPVEQEGAISPGATTGGALFALPFGRIAAARLVDLMRATQARALRVTPWRMLLLEGAEPIEVPEVITGADDPLLHTSACRGAPACPQGTVETRDLARRLAAKGLDLHVSGCAKGCARAAKAAVTLVGRDGLFDLVAEGCAWDAPRLSGLTPDAVPQAVADLTRERNKGHA